MIRKLVVINDCTRECPHVRVERTKGAGCAEDYLCSRVKATKRQQDYAEIGRLIAGYVEWNRERPKAGEFPDWCPLQTAEEGMYLDAKGS